jgi:hypothetical protein
VVNNEIRDVFNSSTEGLVSKLMGGHSETPFGYVEAETDSSFVYDAWDMAMLMAAEVRSLRIRSPMELERMSPCPIHINEAAHEKRNKAYHVLSRYL